MVILFEIFHISQEYFSVPFTLIKPQFLKMVLRMCLRKMICNQDKNEKNTEFNCLPDIEIAFHKCSIKMLF